MSPTTTTRNVMLRRGILTACTVTALLLGAYFQVHRKLIAGDSHTVKAQFLSTQQLREGDPVRASGVEVGKVGKISLDPGRRTSTVRLLIEEDHLDVYRDARVDIRERNLLGGVFVVNLKRGTPSAGALGDRVIPASRTSSQVELEDALSFDQGAARRGLTRIPKELSPLMDQPAVVTDAATMLGDAAPNIARGIAALRGDTTGADLRRLVRNTASAVRGLDAPTPELRTLVSGLGATTQAIASHQAQLRETFALAPNTMRNVTTTLRRLDTTLTGVDRLTGRLQAPAKDIAPTLADLRPTVVSTDRLLRDAQPLLRSLKPSARSLARASRSAEPLLDGLHTSLQRLDEKTLPAFNKVDPGVAHTPAQMIGPSASVLGSGGAGQFDANGHFFRFPADPGESILLTGSLPCRTHLTNPDAAALLACDSLQEAIKNYTTYNPLGPTPGTTGPEGSAP